jgi:hypothetical protein
MYAAEDAWEADGDHETSGIVNNPLQEKTPPRVRWQDTLGLSDTPTSSFFDVSTPAPSDIETSHHSRSSTSSTHLGTMSTTDRPRLPESSLAPKPFGGSIQEMENAERWLRYLNQYVQYRNLRDEEALTLFKLLLTDQAQDWLYALPEDQADSFHRLQEAFMSRYTPNPLQRYQKASHMWSRMQQDNESVDSYFTSIISAANQIKLRDDQQLCFCLIRGLKPHLRLHVLQNSHDSVDEIRHSAKVAEIASAGVVDDSKTIAELSNSHAVGGQIDSEGDRHNPTSRPRHCGGTVRPWWNWPSTRQTTLFVYLQQSRTEQSSACTATSAAAATIWLPKARPEDARTGTKSLW